MRKSRKSEFKHAVNEGMVHAFFEHTYLGIEETVQVKKAIAVKSPAVAEKQWTEYREKCQSLEDARLWGEICGRDAWTNEEMEEVEKMAMFAKL